MALVSYITSIQHFNITIAAGNASNSASLAVGTDETNCVPFMTYQNAQTDDYFDTLLTDVYFTGGSPPTITVERGQTSFSQAINVSVFVIEFDGTNVLVQSGTYICTNADPIDQSVITEVDLTKTAAIISTQFSHTVDDYDHVMVKCFFSDSTHIDFEVYSGGGDASGHWYLFEAQGTEFTVEAFNFSISAGQVQGNGVIASVTMARTMILATFEVNETSDDTNQGSCRIWLYDSTHVYAERGASGGSGVLNVSGFAIQFNSSDGVDVQRGDFNMGAAALTDTDEITAVTQTNSIINNPSHNGMGKSNGSGNDDVPANLVEYNFTDSDTIDAERSSHGGSIIQHNWEVIDFTYGAPPPTAYSGWGINRGINRGIL